jgi:prevent-host-death family protein
LSPVARKPPAGGFLCLYVGYFGISPQHFVVFIDLFVDKFTDVCYFQNRISSGGGVMGDVREILTNTVSISDFNRGLAGRIFESVRKDGPKVVMKNNVPECVLLSPEEYRALMEELEQLRKTTEA